MVFFFPGMLSARRIWRCDMEEGHQICPSMDWHSSKSIAQSIDSSAVDVTGIQSLPWTPRSSIYADTLVNKISSAIN